MAIYSRSDWGARAPKYRNNVKRSDGVFIHHSAGPESQTVKAIQNFHMDTRGWSDIAYSWLVDNKGNIYEGRGWGIAGGHTKNYNSISHAICYIGNTEVKDAPDVAKASINLLVMEHDAKFGAGYVTAHKEARGAATACPGKGLFAWVKAGRPASVVPVQPDVPNDGVNDILGQGDTDGAVYEFQELLRDEGYDIVVDGDFGPKTHAVVVEFQNKLAAAGFYAGKKDGIWGPAANKAYLAYKVTELYGKILDRKPDAEGFKFWTETAAKAGLAVVEAGMKASPELDKKDDEPVKADPVKSDPVVVDPVVVDRDPVKSEVDVDDLLDQLIERFVERLQNG